LVIEKDLTARKGIKMNNEGWRNEQTPAWAVELSEKEEVIH
jgi:hypothetical protein